jgi:hypothetical protein
MALAGILRVLFGSGQVALPPVRSLGKESGLLFLLVGAFHAKRTPRDNLPAFCRDWIFALKAVAAGSAGWDLSGSLEESGGHCLEVELLHTLIGKIGNVHPAGPVAFQLGKEGIAGGCRFGDWFMKLSLLSDQGTVSAL